MTPEEHQAVEDIARLNVHVYFDHYLTDIFPRQIKEILGSHNQDAEAHDVRIAPLEKSRRKMTRLVWMILGGSVVVGAIGGVLVEHLPQLFRLMMN